MFPGPSDSLSVPLEIAVGLPRHLRFATLSGEPQDPIEHELLLVEDCVDEPVEIGEPVGRRKDLEPSTASGSRRVPEPLDGFGIVPERCDALEGIGDVVERRCGPCVVPVEDPDRTGAGPGEVPRTEVTVTHVSSPVGGPDAAAQRVSPGANPATAWW